LLLSLGDNDAKNAVLHGSLDTILVDANREAEGSREFADGALRDPVLGLGLLRFLSRFSFGNSLLLVFGSVFTGIFNGGLVSLVLVFAFTALGYGTAGLGTFNGWRSTGGVGALGAAADVESLIVDEFDFYILLFDAWKFTLEFVDIAEFLDIEARGECLQGVAAVVLTALSTAAILIEVIEQTEEWVEGGGGGGVV